MPNNTSKEEMKLNEEKLKNYEPSQFKKGMCVCLFVYLHHLSDRARSRVIPS